MFYNSKLANVIIGNSNEKECGEFIKSKFLDCAPNVSIPIEGTDEFEDIPTYAYFTVTSNENLKLLFQIIKHRLLSSALAGVKF